MTAPAQLVQPQKSAPQQQGVRPVERDPDPESPLDGAKTLICALNLLSRNLPLPRDVYDAVSSIYHGASADNAHGGLPDVDCEVPLCKVSLNHFCSVLLFVKINFDGG